MCERFIFITIFVIISLISLLPIHIMHRAYHYLLSVCYSTLQWTRSCRRQLFIFNGDVADSLQRVNCSSVLKPDKTLLKFSTKNSPNYHKCVRVVTSGTLVLGTLNFFVVTVLCFEQILRIIVLNLLRYIFFLKLIISILSL